MLRNSQNHAQTVQVNVDNQVDSMAGNVRVCRMASVTRPYARKRLSSSLLWLMGFGGTCTEPAGRLERPEKRPASKQFTTPAMPAGNRHAAHTISHLAIAANCG